ncbi:hypothetical protein MNBD_GAMMA25-2131 [hydrothermal vent metagenome]|uniref:Outer membrane protein beta-barrel domain-containing protein n=1 Tax=hydrothermal vent metagenome TaxID=652676 RepID=A0A3B1BIT6_9ZZZZ
MHNQILKLFLFPLAAILLAMPPLSVNAGAFDKGAIRGTILLGSGRAFGDNYTILGVGAGYYIIDGLELGIDAETWMGGTPSINQISPSLRYVFRNSSSLSPYVGAFYRKTYIENLNDLTATGYRLGAYINTGSNIYIGAGAVFINYSDCTTTIYTSCSDTYPEFTLGVAF